MKYSDSQKLEVVLSLVSGELFLAEAIKKFSVSKVTIIKWLVAYLEERESRSLNLEESDSDQIGSELKKKVTIKDIAADLQTSISTVSRALSGAEGVSSKKRKIIVDYAAKQGFEPNAAAQMLKKGRGITMRVLN